MRMKVLGIFAVVALVAACETAPEEKAVTTGTGGAGAAASTSAPATPAGPKAGSQEDLVVNVGDRVYFDFDKHNLKPQERTTLEAQAAWLKKFPALTITVEGHCDERGTREYNLGLGERRANAVKDYLTALGIAPSRIKTISYGEERPVALGSTNAAWALNRRGVTVISGGAGS